MLELPSLSPGPRYAAAVDTSDLIGGLEALPNADLRPLDFILRHVASARLGLTSAFRALARPFRWRCQGILRKMGGHATLEARFGSYSAPRGHRRMNRNRVKRYQGDRINAVLVAAG